MTIKPTALIHSSLLTLAALLAGCGDQSEPSATADLATTGAEIATLQQQVATLETRVQQVKDANAIKRLQRAYGYYVEEGLWDDAVNLFADNATLELARDGVYIGKERIRQYYYALGNGQLGLREGQLNEQLQVMPVVTLGEDGTTASARWRNILLTGQLGEHAEWGEGPFENEYVKENGVWKFSKVRWQQDDGWRPKVLMGMDTPWRGGWRQYFAKVALAGYFKGVDGVLVAGVGAQEYAKRLGFSQDQIYRGLYAWDESMALRVDRGEVSGRAFLFVGRYVPAKGLDVLLDAYRLYRKRVQEPWDLWCCGAGPMGELIVGREGVVDYGFVQPDDVPSKFSKAEVFVVPSLYEPWGVAIAEAMGCGLPVICTDRCGAGWDLVEEGITGWRIKSGDVEALAAAMQEAHRSKERLRGMGHEAKRAAGGFTADAWGERIHRIARDLVRKKGGRAS